MPRRSFTRLAVPLTVVAAWAAPSAADAALYCVNAPPCQGGTGLPAGRLQDALDLAAASSAPDTIEIGPRDIPYDGPFSYAGASPLELKGSSKARTVLAGPAGATVLDLSGPAVTVADLGIVVSDGSGARGLVLAGKASRVGIRQSGAREHDGTPVGVSLREGAELAESSVSMRRGDAVHAGDGDEPRRVVDSALSSLNGAGARASAPLVISRTHIAVAGPGVVADGPQATVELRSDLVRTTEAGLSALSGAQVDASHVTVVKEKPGPAAGIQLLQPGGSGSVTVTLRNSIVHGYATATSRVSTLGGKADLVVRYSALSGSNAESGEGTTDLSAGNRVAGKSDFVAPDPVGPYGLRDYRLAPGSGAVDAAEPPGPGAPLSVDLVRNMRPVDGDGDGEARADMGAYESPVADPADPAGPAGPADPADPAQPPVPATPAPPPATPNRPQPPAPTVNSSPAKPGLAAAVAGRRALLGARKGSVPVRIACPKRGAACTGRVMLMRGRRTLASRAFALAAGERARLKLSVPPAARRLVRGRHVAKLRVAVRA